MTLMIKLIIFLTISASMHPTDHMSIALVYPFGVSIISGARYQRVATYSVKSPTWSCAGSEILEKTKTDLYSFLI